MANSSWSGEGKGTALGHKILIAIVRTVGPFPAYFSLIWVIIFYLFKDKNGKNGLKEFYLQLNNKKPSLIKLFSNYYSFGMTLIDKVVFLVKKRGYFKFKYYNEDYIEKALEEEKGAILLSAHIGNWDIAGNLLQNRLKTTINAVMVDNEKEEIKEAVQKVNERRDFNIIPLKTDSPDTIIAIRQALSKNELVCLHGDRTIDDKGIKLPFLGKEALFPDGAFQIAALTEAPIIPVFIIKESFRTYTFKAYDILKFNNISRNERKAAIEKGVRDFIKILEHIVRKRPDQWFNFYSFWK